MESYALISRNHCHYARGIVCLEQNERIHIMSPNILAQSVTQLSVSSPDVIDFAAIVQKNSARSVKGVTRERLLLNFNKLCNACRDEVRSLLGIQKGRLPDEINVKVEEAVQVFIQQQVNRVHPGNALSFRTYFAHDFRNLRVVERVNALGENTLALKEQSFGVTLLLNKAEERLTKFKADLNRYTREGEEALQKTITELSLTKKHIEASIAAITKVTTETKP